MGSRSIDGRGGAAQRNLGGLRIAFFLCLVLSVSLLVLEGGLQLAALAHPPASRLPGDGRLPTPIPGAYRVLAVGDSWVYGAESEPEQSFIEVFARGAAKELGRPVQVVNLGRSGSNSAQAFLSLADALSATKPDLVVALTGANDLLHTKGQREAAARMGVQAPPRSDGILSRLRILRLARLIWLNMGWVGVRAQAPSRPRAPPRILAVELPWWDAFVGRRWGELWDVLDEVARQRPGSSQALLAWRALCLAHRGALARAELDARGAIRSGVEAAVAWEARAVIAEQRGRHGFAMEHRLRAVGAPGNPWIRARARGLVLAELERADAAERWLLAALDVVPGDLASLRGLLRIPPAARSGRSEAAIEAGPGGRITPLEGYRFARAANDERAMDRLREGRAAEQREPQTEVTRTVAELGALAATRRCGPARQLALSALVRGARLMDVEAAVGACLSPDSLRGLGELVRSWAPAYDLEALEAGATPSPPLHSPPTELPWWQPIYERRWADLPSGTPSEWRALALAMAGDEVGASWALSEADPLADGAVLYSAQALLRRLHGDGEGELRAWIAASEARGHPWIRAQARAQALLRVGRSAEARALLLDLLRGAPGLLEPLEALGELPYNSLFPEAQGALAAGPHGRLNVERWLRWQAGRGRSSWDEESLRTALPAPLRSPGRPTALPPLPMIHSPEGRALLDAAVHPPPLEPAPPRIRPITRAPRYLKAMAALSRAEGAAFVALNYPFPGPHHRSFRRALERGLRGSAVPLLDLYGAFERRFSQAQWEDLRTPEDHLDHRGYRVMGEELLRRAEAEGWLR